MDCPRCQGRMVREQFEDILDTCLRFIGWRCLICGEILDDVVVMNRRAAALALAGSPKPVVAEPYAS
jgi:hypothetical protein